MCQEHPRYKGVRKPAAKCPECWRLFAGRHPDAEMPASSVIAAMDSVLSRCWRIMDAHETCSHHDGDWI